MTENHFENTGYDNNDYNDDRNVKSEASAAAERLSYDHYFEKKSLFRRAATKPPNKIIQPYGSRFFSNQFIDMAT